MKETAEEREMRIYHSKEPKEILFRAKSIKTNAWVHGYYVNCCYPMETNKTGHFIIEYPNKWHEIYLPTLCEYTGLQDKDGNKIWQHDLIRYSYDYPGSIWLKQKGLTDDDIKYYVGEVFYQIWRGSWSVCAFGTSRMANQDIFTYLRNPNRVEVVGNVFDNPELIEK